MAGMLVTHAALAWHLKDLIARGYPDFAIFYSAGKIIASGQGQNLYDPKLQFQVQQEFASRVSIRHAALPYNHPPFEALVFAPLARIGYLPAYLLWNLINVVILCAIPILLRSYVPILSNLPSWSWTMCSLAFFPIFETLIQGQDSIVLLFAFVLAFVAMKKGQNFSAGCWLALGLFRFHLVLPMLALLLFRRQRKVMIGFSTVAASLLVLSMSAVGWRTTLHYPHYLLQLEASRAGGAIVPSSMPTIQGIVAPLLSLKFDSVVSIAVVGLVSLMLIVVAAQLLHKLQLQPVSNMQFAWMIAIAVLLSFHAYAHDLSVLWLAVLLVADHLYRKFPARDRLIAWVPTILLCLSPLYVFLWFGLGRLNLLVFVLAWWTWAIWREIAKSSGFRYEGQSGAM